MRIAMWSGPRNLSTAMMYAFGARADCAVVDEPFYAAFLAQNGLDHPMRDAVLAAQPNIARDVVAQITGPIPGGAAHWYQKHMAHHMLDGMDLGWMDQMVNVFLLRHPARVIASYVAKRENPTLEDIGFPQQLALMQRLRDTGHRPVLVDSFDIRENPAAALEKLCDQIGLGFDPTMLHWTAGGHPDDGVWAEHWYGAVRASTGFAGPEGPAPEIPDAMRHLLDAALPIYEEMRGRVGQI